jgi:DnaJ-class molecular chaperone
MKEKIADILREFESKLWSWDRTRTNAHSTTTERPSRIDFARKILAHLKEKGWRSGEEVVRLELKSYHRGYFKNIEIKAGDCCDNCQFTLDPEAQISDTCPDCGGSGMEGCIEDECTWYHRDYCRKFQKDISEFRWCPLENPCPTCTDGKVWHWVRCEDCEGMGGNQVYVSGGTMTRDMAIDAGMPEMAGAQLADDVDIEPCQPCNASGLIPLTNERALERAGQKYEIIKKGVKK